MTKQITDVTAYLLATGGVFLAAVAWSLFVWFVKKYFFERIANETKEMETLVRDSLKLSEEHLRSVKNYAKELAENREKEILLARLDERTKVIEGVLTGLTHSMVGVAQDHMQSLRRELQKMVKDEISRKYKEGDFEK